MSRVFSNSSRNVRPGHACDPEESTGTFSIPLVNPFFFRHSRPKWSRGARRQRTRRDNLETSEQFLDCCRRRSFQGTTFPVSRQRTFIVLCQLANILGWKECIQVSLGFLSIRLTRKDRIVDIPNNGNIQLLAAAFLEQSENTGIRARVLKTESLWLCRQEQAPSSTSLVQTINGFVELDTSSDKGRQLGRSLKYISASMSDLAEACSASKWPKVSPSLTAVVKNKRMDAACGVAAKGFK